MLGSVSVNPSPGSVKEPQLMLRDPGLKLSAGSEPASKRQFAKSRPGQWISGSVPGLKLAEGGVKLKDGGVLLVRTTPPGLSVGAWNPGCVSEPADPPDSVGAVKVSQLGSSSTSNLNRSAVPRPKGARPVKTLATSVGETPSIRPTILSDWLPSRAKNVT